MTYANGADPDQTAPEGVKNKVLKILGHLPYLFLCLKIAG